MLNTDDPNVSIFICQSFFNLNDDFDKFIEGLDESIKHIKENAPEIKPNNNSDDHLDSDIKFEDLGN